MDEAFDVEVFPQARRCAGASPAHLARWKSSTGKGGSGGARKKKSFSGKCKNS